MSKKNPLSDNEKLLNELAKRFEQHQDKGKTVYLEDDEFADLVDWYDSNYQPDRADEVMDMALKLHPESSVLKIVEANRCLMANDWEEAERIVDSVDENSSDLLILKAKIKILYGEIGEAEALLNSCNQDTLDCVSVASMFLDTNYPEKAKIWLDKCPEKDKDEFYYSTLASYYFVIEDIDNAKKLYNQLIDMDAFSAFYWTALARCHFKQRQLDKAIEECDFAIINDEDFGDAYSLRGDIYAILGNDERAYADYKICAELNAGLDDYINDKTASMLIADERWEDAIAILNFNLKHDEFCQPLKMDYMAMKGVCLFMLGRIAEAHKVYKEILRISPRSIDAYLQDGRAYLTEGKYNEAVAQWNEAVKIGKRLDFQTVIYEKIAYFFLECGYLEAARVYLIQAIESDPEAVYLNKFLALISLVLKDTKGFMKYNALSEKPLSDSQVKAGIKLISDSDDTTFDYIIKELRDDMLDMMDE